MTTQATNPHYAPPFAGLAMGYMTIMYFAGMGLFWLIKGEPPLLGAWIIWLPLSIAGGLCYAPLVRANARKRANVSTQPGTSPNDIQAAAREEHRAA